ncbi:MAG: hypothetical protein FWD03_04810 [Defluviitaleaceae bacterium]|nr:hypothetical protein [Defluviitaleaceae bacterium]
MDELKEIFRMALETEKARAKGEWALLKKLKGQAKLSHILEYYKFHMVILSLVLIFVGSGVYRIFNPHPEPVLTIAWIAGFEQQENLDALAQALADALVESPDRETVLVIPFIFMGRAEFDAAIHSRLAAMITAADIDITISTIDIDEYGDIVADLTPFWALQDIYPFLEIAGLPADNVLYLVEPGWDSLPYGVFLTDSVLFEELGISVDGRFLSVLSNTNRVEAVMEAVGVIWGDT